MIRSVRQRSGSIKQKWFSSVRTMSDRLRNSGCGMMMSEDAFSFCTLYPAYRGRVRVADAIRKFCRNGVSVSLRDAS